MITADDRDRLNSLPRDEDYGLRPQDPIEMHARDDILIRCSRLRRDGITFVLPPVVRRTR